MNRKAQITCGLAGFVLAFAAVAETGESPETAVGTQTRSLLEVQRSGQEASGTSHPPSGEVAKRTHQRYVESFSQPVPESFAEQEKEFVREGD